MSSGGVRNSVNPSDLNEEIRWWVYYPMCTTEETMSSMLAAELPKFDPYEALSLVTTFNMPDGRFNLVDVPLQSHRHPSTIILDSRMKGFAIATGITDGASIMEQHVAILCKVLLHKLSYFLQAFYLSIRSSRCGT